MKYWIAALAGFALSTPAHAEDWHGFKWGMTEEQVEAVESDVTVYRLETEKRKRLRPNRSTLGGIWSLVVRIIRPFSSSIPKGAWNLLMSSPLEWIVQNTTGCMRSSLANLKKKWILLDRPSEPSVFGSLAGLLSCTRWCFTLKVAMNGHVAPRSGILLLGSLARFRH